MVKVLFMSKSTPGSTTYSFGVHPGTCQNALLAYGGLIAIFGGVLMRVSGQYSVIHTINFIILGIGMVGIGIRRWLQSKKTQSEKYGWKEYIGLIAAVVMTGFFLILVAMVF